MSRLLGLHAWEKIIAFMYQEQLDDNEIYCLKLCKKLRLTYSHVSKILTAFKEVGWIEATSTTRRKRITHITLTEKGQEMAQCCYNVLERHIQEGLSSGLVPTDTNGVVP